MYISVIIPNYNHGAFLQQRIESVLNQTFQDFELIILDDCSTDNSKAIIETYRYHPKVSTIEYNLENTGSTFLQWKKGIELAKGEWIWIAESDDWCETTLLVELTTPAIKYSDCTLSYCQSIIIRNNEILTYNNENSFKELLDGRTFALENLIKENNIVNASMCIFKRSEYFNISQEFTKYKFMGDCLFWIEIALKGKVHVSGKHLNYFRKHENDVSSSAYTLGHYYSEYFQLLKFVDLRYNLIGDHLVTLLQQRQQRFLIDKKIEPSLRKPIDTMFKKYLGFKYYKEPSSFFIKLMREKSKILQETLSQKIKNIF